MARGHRLNISIVLAAVHGPLGLPGRCARSSLHSLAPSVPTLSPSLISILASVDVKQNVYGLLLAGMEDVDLDVHSIKRRQ